MSIAADVVGDLFGATLGVLLDDKEGRDPLARELSLASWLVLTQLLMRLRAKGVIDGEDVSAIREGTEVANAAWAGEKNKHVKKIGERASAQVFKLMDALDSLGK